ncbi:MAG TPA: hypothetical protein VIP52_05275 [Candidatus Dormibacteraeota bacterium]
MQHLLSPERSFEVIEGQVVGFFATLVKNDLWISLKPDGARETGAVRA